MQLRALQEYLRQRPRIRFVFVDFMCLAQGSERSPRDKAEFGTMLPNINLLYLGCSVICVMFDETYMQRFWPQFEAWLTFMQASESGLVSTPEENLRCSIECLGDTPVWYANALKDRWLHRDAAGAHHLLSKPWVEVTNQSDKEVQLYKISHLDFMVRRHFTKRGQVLAKPMAPSGSSVMACSDGTRWELPSSAVHYEQQIGHGGFSVVYRAKIGAMPVAAKKVSLHVESERAAAVHMLRHELRAAQKLEHPHVIRLYGVVVDDPKSVCLLMELAPHGSLRQKLSAASAAELTADAAAQGHVALGIASGMAFLHAREPPMLHHDLKSANVLLFDGLVPKLADFGLSTGAGGSTSATQSTVRHAGAGTIAYKAPEAWDGVYGKANEVYAFGIILWELLTGAVPWDGSTDMQVMKQVCLMEERPPLAEALAGSALGQLAVRCWAQEADARPNFAEIEAELQLPRPPLVEKRWDVFVSFTNKDLPGVASSLQQQLELLGATVFNQKRDFADTPVSMEAMRGFVRQSCVVFALITPHYFDSAPCRAEVEAAAEAGIVVKAVHSGEDHLMKLVLDGAFHVLSGRAEAAVTWDLADDPTVGAAVRACFRRGENLLDVNNAPFRTHVADNVRGLYERLRREWAVLGTS